MNSFTRKIDRLEDLHCLKTEMDLRQKLLQEMSRKRAKQELATAAQTDDEELIDLLLQTGFTAETLPALSLAPVALVAWGSGCVTMEERAVAMQAALDSEISDNKAAIAKFESWLDKRPDPNLFYLWANVTTDQMSRALPETASELEDRTIQLAEHIASASGGFMGFGVICHGEQEVINGVRHVLQRRPTEALQARATRGV